MEEGQREKWKNKKMFDRTTIHNMGQPLHSPAIHANAMSPLSRGGHNACHWDVCRSWPSSGRGGGRANLFGQFWKPSIRFWQVHLVLFPTD